MRKSVLFLFLMISIGAAQQQKIRIACVGNSITWGGLGDLSYPEQLQKMLGPEYDVRNYGVSGRTLLKKGDFPYWKDQMFIVARAYDPHIVIIKLGTNDSKPWNWTYKQEFFSDYMDLVAAFRAGGRRPQIYVCFPVPVFKTNWGINDAVVKNEIIPLIDSVRRTAKTYWIDFYSYMQNDAPMFPDGVHPNAAGYEKMAALVRDTIIHGQSGVIRYFTASAAVVNKGESATLSWRTSSNDGVFLNGTAVLPNDTLRLTPVTSQQYVLTTNGTVKDTSILTVEYFPPGRIRSFRVNVPYYESGASDSISFSWSTGTGSIVSLNGTTVDESGSSSFFASHDTTLTLNALGEMTDSRTISITGKDNTLFNRAYGRSVTASSSDWRSTPVYAVDGDTATMWKSASGKSQWIMVDMGKTVALQTVRLKWGDVYGINYYLYLQKENGETVLLRSSLDNDGGNDELTGLSGTGRYVKILCTKNNTMDDPYQLKELELYASSMVTPVEKEWSPTVPEEWGLEQNFPNPFNPVTTIQYSLPYRNRVNITVYTLIGSIAEVLVNEEQSAGVHSVSFDGSLFPSGVYFVRLSGGSRVHTRMMLLVK